MIASGASPATAVGRLRTLAIDLLVGHDVGADELIRAGLDALLAGVEAPSLPLLAGLTRQEEPDARPLFAQLVEELKLVPDLPAEPAARWWALVHWWAGLIVAGELGPGGGANLIWQHGWHQLGYPDTLIPMVGAAVAYDDWATSYAAWDVDRQRHGEAYTKDIIDEAHRLLERR